MDYSTFTFTILLVPWPRKTAPRCSSTLFPAQAEDSPELRAPGRQTRMFRPKGPRIASVKCPGCSTEHPELTLAFYLYICPACKRYLGMPSQARIALIADAGTFRELDRKLVSKDPLKFVDS